MTEKDPTGKSAHEPGAKLDAGKLRPHLVLGGFANAIEEVVKVGTDGAAKYTDNGWREVENGEQRYLDALGRHLLAFQRGEERDPMSGSRHLAHVAWNALAVLELRQAKAEATEEREFDYKLTEEEPQKAGKELRDEAFSEFAKLVGHGKIEFIHPPLVDPEVRAGFKKTCRNCSPVMRDGGYRCTQCNLLNEWQPIGEDGLYAL